MRIAFLTSCLAPGRDGVGDYTAALAEECARLGHETALLALHDPFADSGKNSRVLRLRNLATGHARAARDFLDAFAPDWVSLQFVCYGFHPRGLNFLLGKKLAAIIGARPVQIMFHELWLGAENGASIKDRLLGGLQRRGVLGVLRALRPRVVQTSNSAYAAVLRALGVPAERLLLFGAIPILESHPTFPASDEKWRFGMFGTLHPAWSPEPLFSHLRQTGKRVVISHIGRIGAGGALWEKLERDYGDAFEFVRLGEQPPRKIAELFSQLNFGIATTPWEIIGKSATATAMLEHGLPVVVTRDDVHFAGWRAEGYSPLLIKLDHDLPARLAAARRLPAHRALPQVAHEFLHRLERASAT